MIRPQRVAVRDRLEEIVASVSPLETEQIVIEVDRALEAELDVDALDRIVTNLVSNACRYGEPADLGQRRRGARRAARDGAGQRPGRPGGVRAAALHRFARSSASASTVTGTGLGLAIARSYARAHRGEVSYRPAAPRGAAFELTLPRLNAA